MGEGRKRQTIKHLPEELIWEILLSNLPVKSLVRFKSVSKSWGSLISSSKFLKDHLNRSNSDPDLTHHNLIGTFYHNETGLSVSSCPLKSLLAEQNQDDVVSTWDHPDRHAFYIQIIGSCNGLMLINDSGISLWNPSSGKLKAIPQPDCSQYEPGYDADLPRLDYYVCGFGYDDSTDDYKVVWVILVPGIREIYQMLIYSVRNYSWKKIDEFEKRFQPSLDCRGPRGTFVNGKLHWLGWLKVKEGVYPETIASLGLVEGEEKYQAVALPSNFDRLGAKLANLGGYLSLIAIKGMMDMNLWVMMKYGVAESWTKIWTFSDFHNPRPIYDGSVQPFWVTKNGDIFVAFRKSKVVVYNAKNKVREYRINKDELQQPPMNATSRDRNDFSDCKSRLGPPLLVYVESLVSP